MNAHETRLSLTDVGMCVGVGDAARILFEHVFLDIELTSRIALCSPSGSGKTTIVQIASGLAKPTSGTVTLRVNGRTCKMSELSEHVQCIPQHPLLAPEFTIEENISLPARIRGTYTVDQQEYVHEILARIGLLSRRNDSPQHLSGGQKQMIACARALLMRPAFLIADEPTAHLDPYARDHVMDLFSMLADHGHCGLLIATHDPIVAQRMNTHYTVTADGLIQGRFL